MKANPTSDEVSEFSDKGQMLTERSLWANVGWKPFADVQASVWKEVNNEKKEIADFSVFDSATQKKLY